MKKYISFLCAVIGLFSLVLVSCSDDLPEREPSYKPASEVVQVYFPASNTTQFEVEPVVNKVSVILAREVTTSALDVHLSVLDTAGVFTTPSVVSFAAGEAETTFDVSFEGLEFFKNYLLVVSFDEKLTNPYVEIEGTQEFLLRVMQSDWEDVATGEYYSDWFEKSWEQNLQYSELLDRYRFPNVWFDGFHFEFDWDGESAKITPPSADFPTGDIHSTYGMLYAGVSDDESDTYYDATNKQLVFDVAWNVPGVGSFGSFPEIFTFSE